MAADDEFARAVANQQVKPPTGPRVSEWPGMRDDLAAICDRLDRLTATLIKVNGKNPPKFTPYPRPNANPAGRAQQVIERNRPLVQFLDSLPRVSKKGVSADRG